MRFGREEGYRLCRDDEEGEMAGDGARGKRWMDVDRKAVSSAG